MTRPEKIDAARTVLNAAVDSFQAICIAAIDDALPPIVTFGPYVPGNGFEVTLEGEGPFFFEYQDRNGPPDSCGWVPVGGGATYNTTITLVTNPMYLPEGFNWRCVAAAGGDHVSEYATGEVLPEAFSTE